MRILSFHLLILFLLPFPRVFSDEFTDEQVRQNFIEIGAVLLEFKLKQQMLMTKLENGIVVRDQKAITELQALRKEIEELMGTSGDEVFDPNFKHDPNKKKRKTPSTQEVETLKARIEEVISRYLELAEIDLVAEVVKNFKDAANEKTSYGDSYDNRKIAIKGKAEEIYLKLANGQSGISPEDLKSLLTEFARFEAMQYQQHSFNLVEGKSFVQTIAEAFKRPKILTYGIFVSGFFSSTIISILNTKMFPDSALAAFGFSPQEFEVLSMTFAAIAQFPAWTSWVAGSLIWFTMLNRDRKAQLRQIFEETVRKSADSMRDLYNVLHLAREKISQSLSSKTAQADAFVDIFAPFAASKDCGPAGILGDLYKRKLIDLYDAGATQQ